MSNTLSLSSGGLVLTRAPGESVMIGDSIRVTVSRVTGNQVRLHISAPRDVEIHRSEVYERVQRERDGRERS